MKIKAPRAKWKYPNRFNDCQLAIEDGLIDLIAEASLAGWRKEEVISAIIEVADNTALALDIKAKLSVDIQVMKLMKKK